MSGSQERDDDPPTLAMGDRLDESQLMDRLEDCPEDDTVDISVSVLESSLCRQRSESGRLGKVRLFSLCHSKIDVVFLQTICKVNGAGRTMSKSVLKDGKDLLDDNVWNKKKAILEEELELDEDEEKNALSRARVCFGERMLQSGDETEKREGLKIIEASSKRKEPCGMLCLALLYQHGLHGIEKDEKRARDLYEECVRLGYQEAVRRLVLFHVEDISQKADNDRLRNALLWGIKHNTVFGNQFRCLLRPIQKPK